MENPRTLLEVSIENSLKKTLFDDYRSSFYAEGLNIDMIKISSLSLLVDNRIHVYINLNFVKVDVKGLINETLVIFR
jgi:hypothetical protein